AEVVDHPADDRAAEHRERGTREPLAQLDEVGAERHPPLGIALAGVRPGRIAGHGAQDLSVGAELSTGLAVSAASEVVVPDSAEAFFSSSVISLRKILTDWPRLLESAGRRVAPNSTSTTRRMMSQVCHWLTNRVWMNMSTSSGIGAGRTSLRVAREACRCPLRDGPSGLLGSHDAHRARHPRDE